MTSSAQPYKIGYARVSTLGQDEALQLDALQKAGADRIFVDRASGSLTDRPALTSALACAGQGDSLLVWRLDRLGRSLRHLIDVVKDLEQRGVALVSLTESLDTTTPGGRLVFHVFGRSPSSSVNSSGSGRRLDWRRPGREAVSAADRQCGHPRRSGLPALCVRVASTMCRPSPTFLASVGHPSTGCCIRAEPSARQVFGPGGPACLLRLQALV